MKTGSLLSFTLMLTCYAFNGNAQANQTLSNLISPTAVNTDLSPGATNSINLGSNKKAWKNMYFTADLLIKGERFVSAAGIQNVFVGRSAGKGNTRGYSLTAVGDSALFSNDTGFYNTALGRAALFTNTEGSYNTATGYKTLYFCTTGAYNTADGATALYSNTTGINNTATGYRALYTNTTGHENTALGRSALFSNTTGHSNNGIGAYSLNYNSTGYSNTAIGTASMQFNTTGYENTATGMHALYSNTIGYGNTANGMYSLDMNTAGVFNAAYGHESLKNNGTGVSNTAVGRQSLFENTTGGGNTGIGAVALYSNTSGASNTALGVSADVSTGNLNYATAIGAYAVVDASSKVRVGSSFITSIGGQVGWSNFSDGRYKRDIQENVPGLVFINTLRPVTFTVDVKRLNEHYDKRIGTNSSVQTNDVDLKKAEDEAGKIIYNGFIAQEVEAAAKKLNYQFSGIDKPRTEDGVYGLRYGDFVVPLVKAVQELSSGTEARDKKIEFLQKQNSELEKRIAKLEGILEAISLSSSSPDEKKDFNEAAE